MHGNNRDENQVGKEVRLYMNKRTGQKAALKTGRQSSEGGKLWDSEANTTADIVVRQQ